MNINLKTFPKCCLDEKHYCEIEIWKEDFETELRKMAESNKYTIEQTTIIEEILGE